jgi:hypothetical protein
MTAPQDEPVGSLGDEAAKLLGVLAGWASERARDLDEHVATGAEECLYCPVCRTVHAVRSASPEVREQLTTAATSLLQAAAGLLSATRDGGEQASRVQRIDLDDADDADDPDQPDEPHDEDVP